MWPLTVPWRDLRFGVELEFVGGRPADLALLPGWRLLPGELQVDDDGAESGGELVPPPLTWARRDEIRSLLARLRGVGARANWDCGLHVHVGLGPWGEDAVLPLLRAALTAQDALRDLVRTADHRLRFCPPVDAAMVEAYARQPGPDALDRPGRPQAHRCGIHAGSWYNVGTVEIRYANGSLRAAEVLRTVELCLRFVAAVGRGAALPAGAAELAAAVGAPQRGYPPPQSAPLWYRERLWMEDALLPALGPEALARVPGEVHHLRPAPDGRILVAVELPDGETLETVAFRWSDGAWRAEGGGRR